MACSLNPSPCCFRAKPSASLRSHPLARLDPLVCRIYLMQRHSLGYPILPYSRPLSDCMPLPSDGTSRGGFPSRKSRPGQSSGPSQPPALPPLSNLPPVVRHCRIYRYKASLPVRRSVGSDTAAQCPGADKRRRGRSRNGSARFPIPPLLDWRQLKSGPPLRLD